jgi:HAD superfamily hydrolase (TIGR01509 family)
MNQTDTSPSKLITQSLKSIKAIFFDAGGTLIHLDSSYICRCINEELDIELSASLFRRAQFLAMSRVAELVAAGVGSTEKLKRDFYSTLLPEVGVTDAKLPAAVECVLKLAHSEMLWRTTDETTARTLGQLKARGLSLAIVSNSDGRIESAFQQAGLAGYFDFFIDSFNVGVEKPDPEIFRLATERAGVAANEAAYVGDLYSVDVVGARNAGLIPVLYDPYNLVPKADCVRISSIEDLLTVSVP